METQSLDDILNGEPAPERAEPAPEADPAPEAAPERPRDELGRFAPKGDTEPAPAEAAPAEGAPPAPVEEEPATVPRSALMDERKKRQTLEGQLQEMNQRLAALTQQPRQQQPPPDPILDPEAHSAHLIEQAGAVAEMRAIQAFNQHRVMMSAEAAKQRLPDYLDKVAVFERLSTENPGLSAQMMQHPDPAQFAYDVAKRHEEISQYGSIDALLAAEKAKWEQEALAKLKSDLPSNVPPTISGDRSVGSRSGPAWSGPRSIEEIIGH